MAFPFTTTSDLNLAEDFPGSTIYILSFLVLLVPGRLEEVVEW